MDEVIMTNSRTARKAYQKIQLQYPQGVLEHLYDRKEEQTKVD
jgi:hypothetical protein